MKEIHPTEDHPRSRPSRLTLLVLALLLVVLVVAGFFAGYLPRRRRESVLAAESNLKGSDCARALVARATKTNAATMRASVFIATVPFRRFV